MIHQPTLWEPPQAPLPPVPTRTKGLLLKEAEIACEHGYRAYRKEMAPGSFLRREGGRWKYHASTGEERNWIPKLVDHAADNWEIVREEVAA